MKRFIRLALPRDVLDPVAKFLRLGTISKVQLALVFIVTTLSVAFEAFGAAMLFPIFEFIQHDRNTDVLVKDSKLWAIAVSAFSAVGVPVSLATLSLLALALLTLRQVFLYARDVLVATYKEQTFRALSLRCFGAVLRTRKRYLQEFGTGAFSFLIYAQCNSAGSIIAGISNLWLNILTVLCYGAIMFVAAPLASVAAGAFGLAIGASMTWLVRKARRLGREATVHGELYSQQIAEKYTAWNLIKLCNAIGLEREKVNVLATRLYQLNISIAEASARLRLIVVPLMVGMTLVALYIGVEHLDLTPAAMMIFFFVLVRVMPLVERFTTIRQHINVIGAYIDRICDVLRDAEREAETDTGTVEFLGLQDKIEFREVCFRYGESEPVVLDRVSGAMPRGKTTAISGPTGAGKSTLADMLPRLATPTSGAILFDGRPIESYTLDSLRRHVSFVDQTPVILNASLADNLRYANPDASQAEIEAACRLAHVDEFLDLLPERYDTVLGERGYRLSGGQRQRLALGRALLKKASILILDEPTSALDYETESKIQSALERIVEERGLTVIIIAHRLATIRNADNLIVLRHGRVIESGSPRQLRHDDSWYRAMLELDAT